MQYITKDSVLKTNALNHQVNTAHKVLKLVGIWKYAAQGEASKISKALAKESPQVQNEEARTPLHYAAENGHTEAANVLLAAGANINARDIRGDTPVHCALRAKREDMALFLVSKGCDLNVTNIAALSGWELAEKISRRFYIQLKENTRCSNPAPSAPSTPAPKPKSIAPTSSNLYNPLLNQVVLCYGQYIMHLGAAPPGGEQPPARPAPYPPTPHEALKMVHGRLSGYINELSLMFNKDAMTSTAIKGSCQTLKDHIARQSEVTKTPLTDAHVYNSLIGDLFIQTNTGIDLLSQYEESVIVRAFASHLEKFTLSIKTAQEAGDKWDSSEFIIDFVKLQRNVLTQLLYIADPERSKHISDGLMQLSKAVQSFVANKKTPFRGVSQAHAFVPAIVDQLRKIHGTLAQSSASSALFPEEEQEVFDSAIAAFDAILKINPLAFGAKRPIQILLSELSYVKQAAFASPPNKEVLLNCALFIHCTCTRVARMHSDKKLKEPLKTVIDHIAGLLMLCGNIEVLVAAALIAKNRNYHFVHMGYALRAIATAASVLFDPAYGIANSV